MRSLPLVLFSALCVQVASAQSVYSPKSAKHVLQHVNYYHEDFPPYTYTNGEGEHLGLGVEILREVYKRLNLNSPHLNEVSWDVAYLTTLISQAPSAAFVMQYSDQRAKSFVMIGPLAVANNQVYCRKGVNINDAESLKYHTYAAEAYTINVDLLRQAGVGMRNIYTYQTFSEVLSALQNNEVQCTALESSVYRWRVSNGIIDPNLLEPVYKLAEGHYYLGFNKMTSPYALALFQQTLDRVRADQRFIQQTYTKYGVFQ